MSSSSKLSQDQRGLVSIIVTLAFIAILSLITISFALLMRREQRQALDRQLSTQAFYAAESGVNDAIQAVRGNTGNINDCSETNNINGKSPDLGNGLRYTCVLIDQQPKSLQYSDIGTNESTIVRVQAGNNANIQKIRISWNSKDGSTNFAENDNYNLPQESFNLTNDQSFGYVGGGTGILRTTLIPVTGTLSRTTLTNTSQTAFLYPRSGSETDIAGRGYSANQTNQGDFIRGNCNTARTPRFCVAEITNLPATSTLYLRLKSIYHPSSVVIEAFGGGADPEPLSLVDTQAVIDATGRANDVLRRIQVRVPINTNYLYPEFAVESADDMCKLTITVPSTNSADHSKCSEYFD